MRTVPAAPSRLPLRLAVTSASRHHAAASVNEPAASAVVPSGVLASRVSVRILAITGKAVIEIASAKNATAGPRPIVAGKSRGSPTSQAAAAAPAASGTRTLTTAMTAAERALRRSSPRSSSAPTPNM